VTDFQSVPNYHEIVRLSNSELSQRTKTALDEYIQAIKQGLNVAEKARLYEAYQDERLKRLNYIKMKYGRAS
jgi:hypothetical protein